ncbi:MAG TPA: penicillin acylase family protein, partial [Thermoanaerobaculia bacterium]
GVPFFNVPGIPNTAETAAARRDILILKSLTDTLELLASEQFAPAFARSTNQNDYRWGKLHRIVLRHPLGGPYNTPPAGGQFPAPLAGLQGIPVDGGFEVVDASSHNSRAATLDGFMFGSGPVRRMVSEATPTRINAVTSLPGGPSGLVASPLYINLLRPWLTNEAFQLDIQSRVILPWGGQ